MRIVVIGGTGSCTAGARVVFDPIRRTWVMLNGASADDVARFIDRCPSKGLSYVRVPRVPSGSVSAIRPSTESEPFARSVPVHNSVKSAGIIKNAKAVYYPAAPHGLTATHQEDVNRELLAFLES